MRVEIAAAKKQLRQIRSDGAVAIEVPTPERVAQAGDFLRVDQTITVVDVRRKGVLQPVPVTGKRLRIISDPFEMMADRGLLDPDADRNRILAMAGRQYRKIHYAAGLEPLQGQDPGKIRSTQNIESESAAERRSNAFAAYCDASDTMDRVNRMVVDMVVLHERPLEEAGRKACHATDRKLVIGIASHELRRGLDKLAEHFGYSLVSPRLVRRG